MAEDPDQRYPMIIGCIAAPPHRDTITVRNVKRDEVA